MDTTTYQILKNVAGSLVRAALVALGTWLLSKGYIDDETRGQINGHAGEITAGVLTVGASLAWAAWQKIHVNKKVDKALDMPAGTSRESLEKAN
jgi:hypothetical protein